MSEGYDLLPKRLILISDWDGVAKSLCLGQGIATKRLLVDIMAGYRVAAPQSRGLALPQRHHIRVMGFLISQDVSAHACDT